MGKSLINGSIYLWTNLINGKKYVGQVYTSVRIRYNTHINDSRKTKPKSGIGSGIKKHGLENFDFRVLCAGITDWEILNKLERYFIAEFDSFRNGYNQNEGGQAEFSRCEAWNDTDEIKHLYLEERMTTYQIADQYECSKTTIVKILRDISVELRDSSEKTYAWEDKDEIARLYTQEHMTTHQLADAYGCSVPVICRILKSIGVELRDSSEKTYAWEDKDEIARLYTEDLMSIYQLADRYECSVSVICNILKDMGIEARDGKNPVWQHKEEIVRLYTEDLLSINQIAEIYECSETPIQSILKSMRIPRRTGRRSQLLRLEHERNKLQPMFDFMD